MPGVWQSRLADCITVGYPLVVSPDKCKNLTQHYNMHTCSSDICVIFHVQQFHSMVRRCLPRQRRFERRGRESEERQTGKEHFAYRSFLRYRLTHLFLVFGVCFHRLHGQGSRCAPRIVSLSVRTISFSIVYFWSRLAFDCPPTHPLFYVLPLPASLVWTLPSFGTSVSPLTVVLRAAAVAATGGVAVEVAAAAAAVGREEVRI